MKFRLEFFTNFGIFLGVGAVPAAGENFEKLRSLNAIFDQKFQVIQPAAGENFGIFLDNLGV